jgi:hypothetical protein
VSRDRHHIFEAVGREIPDAEAVGIDDVLIGLDGVAVVDLTDRHPGPDRLRDLGGTGRVDTGAPLRQAGNHLPHRTRLHREPDGDSRQLAGEDVVLPLDADEIEDDLVLGDGRERRAEPRVVEHGRRWCFATGARHEWPRSPGSAVPMPR